MIPQQVADPFGGAAPWRRRPAAVVRALSLGLLLLALAGTTAWLVTLSPLGLERWHAGETSHNVTFPEPGTYVLFEEGAGASTRRGDAQVIAGVRSIAGRPVPLRPLIDDQGRSPQTYDVQVREGRAIAAIDVDRPGRYIVVTFSATAVDPTSPGRSRGPVDLANLPGLALGPEGEPSSWGTLAGLAVLGGVPALAGVCLAALARIRYPLPLGPVIRPDRGRVRRWRWTGAGATGARRPGEHHRAAR